MKRNVCLISGLLESCLKTKGTKRLRISLVNTYTTQCISSSLVLLLCLSVYLMIYRCGNNLLQCNDNAQRMDYLELTVKCIDVQEDYGIVEENILLLKKILSSPLLVILLSSLFNLLVALTYSLKDEVPPCMMVELTVSTLTGVIIISSLIVRGSNIPENMLKIKGTAGHLIEKHQLNILDKGREIYVLKSIERKETIHLSACGLVDFKRSLLLTAFGSLFTYGLIILKLD
ncbi:hypothetical protein AVEN_162856-1 [Araneus ventricosus]|uniref:Uncharacterized protein n=1 Tax=Araneus ventricosus TaxID=182803 RepID=A0A4Y2C960_ARAVE|nr:hypothetical protein AVEN_162856-1 [Araneus ventricosus]